MPFHGHCNYRHDGPEDAHPDCATDYTDPGLFELHMTKIHNIKRPSPRGASGTPFRAPRAPKKFKGWEPKPTEPGSTLAYIEEVSGHWTGAEWGTGTWIPTEFLRRTGVVWSDGPYSSSRWVLPDHDPSNPVIVELPTPKRARGDTPRCKTRDWRGIVARIENVRRAGGLFPVVESIDRVWMGAMRHEEREHLLWHADPDCPDAAGKERSQTYRAKTTREAMNLLLPGAQRTDGPLCQHCVMLQSD